MKKVGFIMFLSILGSQLAAQNISTFNKTYSILPGYGSESYGVSVVPDGYIVYGVTVYAPGKQAIEILKIDSNGNSIWTKYFPNKYYFFGYTGTSNEIGINVPWGGEIVTGILQNDSTGFYNWALYRFDSEGDTIWTKNHKDSANFWVTQIKITRDKKYVIFGEWIDTAGNWIFTPALIKTDSMGNELWKRTYTYYGQQCNATGIDTCSDGGFIVAYYNRIYNDICSGSVINIMKMDSLGNTQWVQYIRGSTCDMGSAGIVSLKHGGYAVCGFYDDTNNSLHGQYNPVLYAAKLSGSGNVIWSKKYGAEFAEEQGTNSLLKPIELPNGDIVICGNALDAFDSTSFLAGCILKIDSNGNEKWLNFYIKDTSIFYDHYLTDIKVINDGGYIATGYIYGDTTMMWAIKTDSLGVATGIPPLYKVTAGEVRVYPNPSSGQFTFDFNTPVNGTIEIYDITGQRIYQQTLQTETTRINLSGQPDGMYFYTIFEDNKVVQRNKLVIER